MKNSQKALNVAYYMLSKLPMCQKKLHKLLYFSYAYYLFLNNDNENDIINRIFPNHFHGWVHGPVYQPLYKQFNKFGVSDMIYMDSSIKLDKKTKEVVDIVLEKFETFSGNELESLTHNEKAWIASREGLEPFEAGYQKLDDKIIMKQMIEKYGQEEN